MTCCVHGAAVVDAFEELVKSTRVVVEVKMKEDSSRARFGSAAFVIY